MTIVGPGEGPCPFCAYLSGAAECAFITRTADVASFVNVRQYERGALLVVPVRHLPTVFDLDADTLSGVYAEARRVGDALVRAFGATGLNIYQNNGVDAGQSIPHHHIHVVPRYPTSERMRIFHGDDFEPVPMSTQLAVAEAVRAALRQGY
jgi:histidine triad (HIT) family protein